MSITLRYPDGTRHVYHDAHFVQRQANQGSDVYELFTRKGGSLVAWVTSGSGVTIDFSEGSRTIENPVTDDTDEARLGYIVENIQNLNASWRVMGLLKDLKRALTRFDSRSRCWRRDTTE